jgi:hypothetical protein
VNKNNYCLIILNIIFLISVNLFAQNFQSTQPKKSDVTEKADGNKKVKIDYDSDLIIGTNENPDTSFINSRRMIKYRELFNRRTNFIEEIESNKGLFNEHQK